MPQHLSVASMIDKNKLASEYKFLVLIKLDVLDPETNNFVDELYFARNDEDIEYQGNTYQAANFDLETKVESGELHDVSLSVTDYSGAVRAALELYDGGVGSRVTMIIVNSGDLHLKPELEETFDVIGASANVFTIKFSIGANDVLTRRCPRRQQLKDFCSWTYKSSDCGYTGNLPTCAFTLTDCKAHNNATNFSGFPGVKSFGAA